MLIKHSFNCSDEHFQFLKSRFESVGFEVLNKNVQCFITELSTDDLKAVDYVIDFCHVYFDSKYYVHQQFLEDLKELTKMGVAVIRFDSVLCFNRDMGIIETKNKFNFCNFAYKAEMLISNPVKVLMKNALSYKKKTLAIELTDTAFIMQKGKFHKEFLTEEMLTNGNWKI